jgi:hypothetical protein
VKRRWLAEKLVMAYETRVSQAANWVQRTHEPRVLVMKNTLIQCGI